MFPKQVNQTQALKNLQNNILNLTFNTTQTKPIASNAKLSLNKLQQIIKKKNQRISIQTQKKQQNKEWLKDKDIDVRKIQEKIYTAKKEAQYLVKEKPKRIQKYGYELLRLQSLKTSAQQPLILTKDVQEQLIKQQKQIIVYKQIMKSMENVTQRNNSRGNLVQRITRIKQVKNKRQVDKNLKTIREVKRGYQLDQYSKERLNNQNEERNHQIVMNQYFDMISQLSTQGFNKLILQQRQQLIQLKPFWKIVSRHLQTVMQYAPQLQKRDSYLNIQNNQNSEGQLAMNQLLVQQSIKLIEDQFKLTLPKTNEQFQKQIDKLNAYIKSNPKSKIQLFNLDCLGQSSKPQYIWFKAFYYFRAGYINQCQRLIEKLYPKFAQQLVKYYNLKQKTFFKLDKQAYQDSFYNQLYSIVTSQLSYSRPLMLYFDAMQELNKMPQLTETWNYLRTIGIYCMDSQSQKGFTQLKQFRLNSYINRPRPLAQYQIKQIIYMSMYKQLIYFMEMQQNGLIKKKNHAFTDDDYFHLLLFIFYFPQLWGKNTAPQRNGLQIKFVNKLLSYMKKLRSQGYIKETCKYLLLAPPNSIDQLAIDFIRNRQQYDQFDWKQLRRLLQIRHPQNFKVLYLQLSKNVLDKIQIRGYQDYKYAINLYRTTYKSMEDSPLKQKKLNIKLLIEYSYFKQKKKYLLMNQQQMSNFNRQMFNFFDISNISTSEQQLLRKDLQIKKYIQNAQYFLQCDIQTWSNKYCKNSKNMWSNNQNSKHQEVYTVWYIRNILIPFMFYKQVNKLSQLMDYPFQNFKEVRSLNIEWHQSMKQLIYSIFEQSTNEQFKNQISQLLKPQLVIKILLQFFRNQLDSQVCNLYVYYLHLLQRRTRLIVDQQSDYAGLNIFISKLLKQLNKVNILFVSQFSQDLKDKKRSYRNKLQKNDQRQLINKHTNPLMLLPQYKKFYSQLNEYLKTYGGFNFQQSNQTQIQNKYNQMINKFNPQIQKQKRKKLNGTEMDKEMRRQININKERELQRKRISFNQQD